MLTTTCGYGDTLNGKTSFLSSVLHYGIERYKNFRARLYTCENYEVLEPWIQAGVLEVWDLNMMEYPFEAVIQAAMGCFLVDPTDPKSKVVPPSPKDLEEVKVWLYEGMATMGDFLMGNYAIGGLAARAGRGEKIGPSEDTVSFSDGPEGPGRVRTKVGGNPRTHYNVVQRWIHSAVIKASRLPGHVIWTSHEVVAKDERTQRPILGPEIVGTAATAGATRWFGNTIHVMRVDQKEKGKDKETLLTSQYRLYLKAHYSQEIPGIPYKAVMRVPAEVQEEVDKIVPPFIPNNIKSFTELMRLRDEINSLSSKLVDEIMRKVKAA